MNKKLSLILTLISGSSLNSGPSASALRAPSETEIVQEEAASRKKLEKEAQWLEAISQMAQINPLSDYYSKQLALRNLQSFVLDTENPEFINHTFSVSLEQIKTLSHHYYKCLALEDLQNFALKAKAEKPELIPELINDTFNFSVEQIKTIDNDFYKGWALNDLYKFALQNKAAKQELINKTFEFYKKQIKTFRRGFEKYWALKSLQHFALQNKNQEELINKTFYFSLEQIKTIDYDTRKREALEDLQKFVRNTFVEGHLIRRNVLETNLENFDQLVAFVNKKVDEVLRLLNILSDPKFELTEEIRNSLLFIPTEIREKIYCINGLSKMVGKTPKNSSGEPYLYTVDQKKNHVYDVSFPNDVLSLVSSFNDISRAEAVSLISLIPELERAVEEDNESVAYSSDSSDSPKCICGASSAVNPDCPVCN